LISWHKRQVDSRLMTQQKNRFHFSTQKQWRHIQDCRIFLCSTDCCRMCFVILCSSVSLSPLQYNLRLIFAHFWCHDILDKFVHLVILKRQQNIK
jgi:hypothetical protein